MSLRLGCVVSTLLLMLLMPRGRAQQPSPGSSSSAQHVRKPAPVAEFHLDAGSFSNGVYRNPSFGFCCKIPAGWVLRTDEMNSPQEQQEQKEGDTAKSAPDKSAPAAGQPSRVLFAAFARPPMARGEDVNSSILIAAESADAYPGLKDAAQYFAPLTEIAKAQGFEVINEPYESEIGAKTIVRADFQKGVGTRVMLQSTLVMLAHHYAVSFSFIGGTEAEVEEIMESLSFGAAAKPLPH